MKRYKVSWKVEIAGYVDVMADNRKGAEEVAQGVLGAGISIASNLHAPPGIGIKSMTEVVKGNKLIVPDNIGIGPDGNITPIRPGV